MFFFKLIYTFRFIAQMYNLLLNFANI